jgi:hypothetical protein
MAEKVKLLTARDQDNISQAVLLWLQGYEPDMEFEYLPPERSGIMFTTVQAAFKTAQYIDGGYAAQYQFGVMYRALPTTSGERLDVESLLNELGTWAEENPPDLGEGITVTDVERTTRAGLVARYEDLTEDYQILMTIKFEVEVQ